MTYGTNWKAMPFGIGDLDENEAGELARACRVVSGRIRLHPGSASVGDGIHRAFDIDKAPAEPDSSAAASFTLRGWVERMTADNLVLLCSVNPALQWAVEDAVRKAMGDTVTEAALEDWCAEPGRTSEDFSELFSRAAGLLESR